MAGKRADRKEGEMKNAEGRCRIDKGKNFRMQILRLRRRGRRGSGGAEMHVLNELLARVIKSTRVRGTSACEKRVGGGDATPVEGSERSPESDFWSRLAEVREEKMCGDLDYKRTE